VQRHQKLRRATLARSHAQLDGNFSAHSLRASFITSAAQKKILGVAILAV
jgi:hypothetical protein